MSFVNRQLYKQKPSAWGPASSVQASIFKNAEKIGINPASIALAMPMWVPGNQLDYASGIMGINTGSTYLNNSLEFVQASENASTVQKHIDTGVNKHSWPVTIISNAIVNYYSETSLLYYSSIVSRGGVFTSNTNFAVGIRIAETTSRFFCYYRNGTTLYGGEYSGAPASAILPVRTVGRVAFVLSTGSQFLYINGNKYIVSTSTGSPGTYTGNIRVGGPGVYVSNDKSFPGLVYSTFIFSAALPDSQIAYLSDNPYFLLQRVAPVFYSVPGGAITIKTITDTGLCLDSIAQISNVFAVADAGSGLDGFSGLIAGLSVGDVGEGSDSVTPAVRLTVQDTGAAIDFIQRILSGCSVTDTCAGADNIWQLLSAILVSDICGGADVISILKALLKTVTDSVTGTDTISQIFADILVSDSGAGTDFINLLKDILKTISDTGSGIENVSIQPVSVSVQDASTALDIIWYIAVALSVSDASTIAEIISTIKTKLVNVTDAGLGYDAEPTISVSVTVPDTSAALDIVRQVLNTLSISDSVYGFDRITKTDFDILPSGKVTVTFTIKTPGASLAMRTPKANFNIE